MGAVVAHILRAITAAMLGSIIGTLILVFIILPTDREFAQANPSGIGGAILIFSLIVTVPSSLFLAAPIIWPFRDWAIRHPWHAMLTYGAIGGFAGALVAMLFEAGGFIPVGGLYGAAVGASFIAMLWWTSPRPAPAEPLDVIFE